MAVLMNAFRLDRAQIKLYRSASRTPSPTRPSLRRHAVVWWDSGLAPSFRSLYRIFEIQCTSARGAA